MATAQPPLPTVPDISQFLSTAQQQLEGPNSGYSQLVTAQENQANQIPTDTAATVSSLQQQQGLLQTTYSDLSKEFDVEEGQEQNTAAQTGTANIGAAQVAEAQSGTTNAQGAFNAPVTSAQQAYQSNVAQIAAKYGAKQTDITDALASNQQQLATQIVQAQNSGNEAYASALTSLAQFQYTQNQQVISLAQQAQTAQTQFEQQSWTDYMDSVRSDAEEATIGHLAAEDAKLEEPTTDTYTQNTSGGLQFTNKDGSPITAAAYAKATGASIVDVLSQSNDPNDQAFIGAYNAVQQQIATAPDSTAADLAIKKGNADLQAQYPEIVGQETLF